MTADTLITIAVVSMCISLACKVIAVACYIMARKERQDGD